MRYRIDQKMSALDRDPMVFRPPRLKRGLQIALGLPLTLVVVLPTLFGAWLVWAPHVVELRVDEGWLHVTTAPAPISRHHSFDLATIIGIDEITVSRGRKIAGTGLPGYCVGTFSYAETGRVWQATDCSRSVLVLRRANDNPVVLTPPDRDRFRAALENGDGYHESQTPPDAGRGWFLVKLLVLLAPLLGLLVPLIFFVAPVRLRYRVVSAGLEVITMLGTRRFATAGCTARAHRPKVGLRLWGTGAPGYYTGTYRLDGANAKIYTTSVDEGVLIEGPGTRVFINPENEPGFLEAIRTMGGATS
jgi:Bacterial PH domain